MILDKIKRLMGLGTLPDEVAPIYRGAKNEKEALAMLREARRRDEDRRGRALEDVDILQAKESELMEEGKKETDSNRRLGLARKIKDIRWKVEEIEAKVENILNKRIRIYKEHVASLETIVDLAAEPLPSAKQLEDAAIKAKERREDLDKTVAMAEGMSIDKTSEPAIDEEERAILEEFQKHDEAKIADAEIKNLEKKEIRKESRAPEKHDDEEEELE